MVATYPTKIPGTCNHQARLFYLQNLNSRFRLECFGEPLHVVFERTLVAQKLDICTINLNLTLRTLLDVFFPTQRSEAPVLANNDLLSARELVLRATKSLDGGGTV
jgi:hypothetical protein